MTSGPPSYNIVVAGDVIVDHHIYRGGRTRLRDLEAAAVRDMRETGGAGVLQRLIAAVCPPPDWTTTSAVKLPDPASAPLNGGPAPAYSMAVWSPVPKEPDSKTEVWRATTLLGYGSEGALLLPELAEDPPAADLLVLDDAGFKFGLEQQRACWQLQNRNDNCWTLLKMSDPVARRDLWHELSADIAGRNFVCLMSSQDLRRESVAIRQGVSWERTLEEVHNGLSSHPVLAQLGVCQHLVITFSVDGALWLDRSGAAPRAVLVFDPESCEGGAMERQTGTVVGNMMTMTASVARAIALHIRDPSPELKLIDGIASGLAAMRNLQSLGHGEVGKNPPNGFPVDRIASAIMDKTNRYSHTIVPWPQDGTMPEGWTIAEVSEHPLSLSPPLGTIGLARMVAQSGHTALAKTPHARFGKMISVDRPEIEALRSLRRSMREYGAGTDAKPFSIGVFGPPGAGKSFGVKQLAFELFGEPAWLEFNLSQFSSESDLRGAFHRTRDVVLSGLTPVVFWDEFDSENYRWLRHLLAPMQDGRFQDGQLNHAVGRAIFVFAGGTSERFSDFGPAPDDAVAQTEFRLRKGPDFLSRLDAYYDVSGPNQRRIRNPFWKDGNGSARYDPDPTDVMYPVRRALLIRHQLGCGPADRLDFDSDLLDALLLVPRYRHGARSLEKLVQPLRPIDKRSVRRSALPPMERTKMHVDAEAFHRIMTRLDPFRKPEIIDPIAKSIHDDWLRDELQAARENPTYPGPSDALNKPFDELSSIDKQNNRAAARRIPEVLALAGLTVAPKSSRRTRLSSNEVEAQINFHLERLAEGEHDGWMSQRLADGWTKADARNYQRREHEMLIPYGLLPDANKDKDRKAVRSMWHRLDEQNYEIVWLGA